MAERILRIGSAGELQEVEEMIADSQPNADPKVVQVSTSGAVERIGMECAQFQAMATWARNSKGRKVIADRSSLKIPSRRIHLLELSAVTFAKEVLDITSRNSIRPRAYQWASKSYDDLNNQLGRLLQSPEFLLLCADNTSKAFSRFLYEERERLHSLRYVHSWMRIVVRRITEAANFESLGLTEKWIGVIAELVYELFKNTHQWGRTGHDNVRLPSSIRGLFIKLHSASAKSEDTDTLGKYLAKMSQTTSHFLEVSVFDSGIGYAQRFLAKPLEEISNVETEYRAVHDCLKLRSTSSSELHKGVGLHSVLTALTNVRGFMRLRSGRLSLYRDFEAHPYSLSNAGHHDVSMLDAITGRLKATELENAAGALITSIIPVP